MPKKSKTTEKQTLVISNEITDVLICDLDLSLQIRADASEETIEEYALSFKNGEIFPPIVVVKVMVKKKAIFYLVDGFHRVAAAIRAGITRLAALVHTGNYGDAAWVAIGANRRNGLRLSSTDMRRAIEKALKMFPEKATTLIAKHVGCTQQYVSKIKNQVTTGCNLAGGDKKNGESPKKVVGKDGKSYPATKPPKEKPLLPSRLNNTKSAPPAPLDPKTGKPYKVHPRQMIA